MSFYNAELHCMMSSPSGPHSVSSAATAAPPSTIASDGDGESFFHHILDVINPLQHLPVVGTIYRAITGERIGPIEKIAGDALYGGVWGAATSAADVAFESITGKSVEDTALAWLKGDDNTALASSKVAAPQIAFNTASLPTADAPTLPGQAAVASAQTGNSVTALMASMNAQGLTGDMASRALAAYRRSMAPQAPLVASLN